MGYPARTRLVLAGALAAGLVAGAVVVPSFADGRDGAHERAGAARTAFDRRNTAAANVARGLAPDGHDHRHDDPRTKNAISRAALTEGTADPTTREQAEANRTYVERQRAMADPTLTTVPLRAPRTTVPQSRYAMAGGCYRLRGEPIRFQATRLGHYLLYTKDRTFLAGDGGTLTRATKPSADAEWTVRRVDGRFTFTLADGRALTSGDTVAARPTAYPLRRTTGCPAYPEV
jgi:hypothetical protein